MTPESRLHIFLYREQVFVPFAINAVLGLVITWAAFWGQTSVPCWGEGSVAVDLLITMFMFPLLASLVMTLVFRRNARAGKTPTVPADAVIPAWARILPNHVVLRALAVALAVSLAVCPALLLLLHLSGAQTMTLTPVLVGKSLLCGAVSSLFSPPIALRAILDGAASQPKCAVAEADLV